MSKKRPRTIHVYNPKSRKKHQESADCWCKPMMLADNPANDSQSYVHNPMGASPIVVAVDKKTGAREVL